MSIRHLDALLCPRSLVIVGASDRTGSVGATVWRNVRSGSFKGAIRAVNPAHGTLDGEHVFARCADLPAVPDLAIVCTPPDQVAGIIDELGRMGTHAVVVLMAGINSAQKRSMLDAARPHLLRLLGPNCLGLLAPHIGLNASFAHTDALPGELAFVSQSGALATAMLDWARSRGIGFSHLVSLGDHLDVDFGDMLDYLASDVHTRAILLYIESIEEARKFMSAARAAARNKPVIVVKAGRAGNGVKAAASHTGALAGSDGVIDAAIRRAGMLRVDTLDELFMAAETLSRFHGGATHGLTLMTNGGGAGVMAADEAARLGIALPDPDAALMRALAAILPTNWSHANPFDIIGDAPAKRYVDTLRELLDRPETGTILFMHAPTAIVRSGDIAQACVPIVRGHADRILACWLGDESVAEARRIFEAAGVADYATPEQAVRAFDMVATYRRNQALLLECPAADEAPVRDVATARRIVEQALADGRAMLDEFEGKSLLAAYGIPVVATRRVDPTARAAVEAAAQIGHPVALKILSRDISHKSDAGGVELNLADAAAVHDAATRILARVSERAPQAHVEGFTVQSMAVRPFAQELIVGASVDPVFGPVILFGQGGTAVEVTADRSLALAPLNRVLARDMISRTRVHKLLQGYRDHPPARLEAIEDALVAVAQIMVDLPEVMELDINPLWADADGVLALDARMRVATPALAGTDRFAILPYPRQLEETVNWNGRALLIRPIRPEDAESHREFFTHVSLADMRLRFFGGRRELPASQLARLVQIDFAREMAFVAVENPGTADARTLGVVRAVSDPDNVEAEFALLTRTDLQRHGLGTLLMRKMIAYLRRHGTGAMTGYVLNDNTAMRAFMRRFEFEALPGSNQAGVTQYRLALAAQAEADVAA
jgi:acetyltransferase